MTTAVAPKTGAHGSEAVHTPDIQRIPVEKILESSRNQRRTYDQQQLRELADSILADGLLQPVLLRGRPDGAFDLAAGSRRLRAVKLAKQSEILAIVRHMTDAQFLIIQLSENKHRTDLHPLEEAEGFHDLQGMPGYATARDVADALHLKPHYVAERLKLLELIPKAQEAFRGGLFPVGIAIALAKYPADVQEERFNALKSELQYRGLPTVKQFQDTLADRHHVMLEKAPFALDDVQLLPVAGSCTACPKRTGNQPDLFNDVKGKNTCTDRKCFDAKVSAHVKGAAAAAKAAGEELVQITTRWDHQKPATGKPIPYNQVFEAAKGERGAVKAIYVDGQEPGKIGWVTLQRERAAPKSRQKLTGRGSPEAEARRKAKLQQEGAFRKQLAETILGRVKGPPKPELLAEVLSDLVFTTDLETFGQLMGWKLPKGYQAANKAVRKQILDATSGNDAARVIVAGLLHDNLDSHAPFEPFLLTAKSYGVDAAGERKRFDAARAAETKEAAAQARAAKRVGRARPMADFMKPMTPSTQLAAVIGTKAMPRTDVTKKLWAYIKKHGLQDKKNRRMINADDALRPIFGKDAINMFDMTKKINAHLTLAATNGKPAKRLAGDVRRAKKAKAAR